MKQITKNLTYILILGALVCALAMQVANVYAEKVSSPANQTSVTAIDILLKPDATMLKHAEAGNAPTAYLDKMLAEPFEPFTFSPAGAAVAGKSY